MKPSRRSPFLRRPVFLIQPLESRLFLSATLVAPIPTQSIAVGSAASTIALGAFFNDPTVTGTAVLLQTPLGNIPLVLTDTQTPQTVANFLSYVTSGAYDNTIVHRSVPGFIIQSGGYTTAGTHIPTNGTIPGEHHQSNTTGTIAMALSNGPNSATSDWFINLADNPSLDGTSNTGPYTAFGNVVYNGMNVVKAIADLPIVNDDAQSNAWNTLPVLHGSNGATVLSELASNLVTINPEVLPGGLVYSAVSSDPGLVSATVDASGNLTLAPVNAGGTARITVTATDMGGHKVSSTFVANVADHSGTVAIGTGGAKSCTYTDASGAVVSLSLTGGGSAVLTFSGSNFSQTTTSSGTTVTGTGLNLSSLVTSATTTASVLTIAKHGGTGPLPVGSITTGPLKSLTASGVTLNGNLVSSSTIGTLALAGATNGTISATSITTITLAGSISDALTLSGPGQSFKGFKAAAIAGGTWTILGSAGSLTAGTISNWAAVFSQPLASLTDSGNFSGSLTAPSLGTVSIDGSANSAAFHLNGTGSDLRQFTVKGAFSSSSIDATGSIGAVTAAALLNSQLYAGVNALSNAGVLPGTASDFSSIASIGSVVLKGVPGAPAFVNSDVAAATLGALTLGTLQTASGGTPAGVAAEILKSLSATANKKFALKNVNASSNIASILTADGVTLGDLVISLLTPAP